MGSQVEVERRRTESKKTIHRRVGGRADRKRDETLGEFQKNRLLEKKISLIQNSMGAIPSAFDCFLILRGIKTLSLRMKKHNENGLNKYEEEYLNDQIRRLGNDDKKVHYHKIWALEEGKRFSKKINNYLEKDVIALVVNFVDMLAHDSSKMNVLKEIIPDESGYRKTVGSWVKNSWFNDVLKVLSQSNFDVVITSDHGSIKVNKEIMVSADKDASDGVRYKYGRNLNSKNKNVMKINNPENFKLPTFGPQFNYLLAKNDSYFLYPNEANRYKNKLQNSFQHGGISLEEMLIPVLKMKGIAK